MKNNTLNIRRLSLVIAMLLVVLCALTNCATSKTKKAQIQAASLPENVSYTTSFRIFWDAFTEETRHLSSLETYVPSAELQQSAAVVEHNGNYYFSGYITVNKQFNKETIAQLDGEIAPLTDTTATVQVPLARITDFVHTQGLVAIDAAKKTHLRKH